MILRLLAATAVVAAVSAGVAATAPAAFKTCGTVKGGGATWSVVVAGGVSCRAGKPLVKKLAAKPRTGIATRLGTYLGLKCTELSGNGKREIACVSIDGRRSVFGVTPPRK